MADGADAAGGVYAHAYVVRQADGCLPYSSLDRGFEVLFPITSEIHRDLSGAHIDLEAGERHASQLKLTLACSHVDTQVRWEVFVQMNTPVISTTSHEMNVSTLLCNGNFTLVAVYFMGYGWFALDRKSVV